MEMSGGCVSCTGSGQPFQEAGRQFGGSGYGGSSSGYGGGGYGLPYGGYGGLGGGYNQAFVECCEGVVNPFILLGIIGGLAGLTFFLRQQVVTFINGRSLNQGWMLQNLLMESFVAESCPVQVTSCMSQALWEELQLKGSAGLLLATTAVGGLELAATKRLAATWPTLRSFPLVQKSYHCLQNFNHCHLTKARQ